MEFFCGVFQGDMLRVMVFDEGNNFIDIFPLLCREIGMGGHKCPAKVCHEVGGVSAKRHFPHGCLQGGFLYTTLEKLAKIFIGCAFGAQKEMVLQAQLYLQFFRAEDFDGMEKLGADPKHNTGVGLRHIFVKNRTVADSRRH